MPKFTVTKDPDRSAQKFLITARPGGGKTFFCSTIPDVFMLSVEEGLKGASPDHAPAHFKEVPKSLGEFVSACAAFIEVNKAAAVTGEKYKHFVVDSLSGLEELCHAAAVQQEQTTHMDGKDYKVVWSAAQAEWKKARDALDAIRRTGVHVWCIAHAAEAYETTQDGDTFRKWDLAFRGSGQTQTELRQFWRGWADHVFFIEWAAKLTAKRKGKRQMGQYDGRVLITREDASHFAKTRSRLPNQLPATWPDLARAMQAGAVAPPAKLGQAVKDVVANLSDDDRKEIEKDIERGVEMSEVLSRANGMAAIKAAEESNDEEPATQAAAPQAVPSDDPDANVDPDD